MQLKLIVRISPQTHQSTAVRVAIEMGIFNVMATAKETSISLEALASNTGADPPLISKDTIRNAG